MRGRAFEDKLYKQHIRTIGTIAQTQMGHILQMEDCSSVTHAKRRIGSTGGKKEKPNRFSQKSPFTIAAVSANPGFSKGCEYSALQGGIDEID